MKWKQTTWYACKILAWGNLLLPSCQDFVHNFRTPLFVMRLPYKTEPNWSLLFDCQKWEFRTKGCYLSALPFLIKTRLFQLAQNITGRLTCSNLSLSWVSCWVTGFLIFPFHPLVIKWDGYMALPALWISSSCCSGCQQFLNGSHGRVI